MNFKEKLRLVGECHVFRREKQEEKTPRRATCCMIWFLGDRRCFQRSLGLFWFSTGIELCFTSFCENPFLMGQGEADRRHDWEQRGAH